MDLSNILLIIGIILLVAVIVYMIVVKSLKNKTVKGNIYHLTIDLNALIVALKGKENINDVSATSSKVRFELKDTHVDVEAIKALGASGIVESNNSITIIFGKQSQSICDAIKGELS